ncbi:MULTISPECIES: DUF1176 domain-containing protein [unclassified Sphingomonas]|uniref:DUF1176 domain-containing protein n=1 Tax=Sphingomonas TaxID=13687 RepID=UPI00095BC1C7|nr:MULTISPECIES: DUF1176 domain-containing protein [unclassified Sphingomonas]MBN8809724.1 DUF1176 domain-containing protein [Sphingomonas sp.]OJY50360.1 MAG: hypothetical protein BGP17_18010 [Sphingomonas sp. 67-41]
MLMLALLAALADDPQPGALKLYGDWAVACDNTHRCEMTSLYPPDGPSDADADYQATASLTRAAGPEGSFAVELYPANTVKGRVSVRVDDVPVASVPANAAGDTVTLAAADSARLAAAMANGKRLTLTDASGKLVARISLAGSSAALRHIDADQGRAGTVTAAVAKGARAASAVPGAPVLPRIAALRPSGAAAALPPALRASLEQQGGCNDWYEGTESRPETQLHALGGGKTLVLIPCGAGAYNYNSLAFILSGGKAVEAGFDLSSGEGEGNALVNAGWDKGVLSSYYKGRGVGDCGLGASYVWDGTRFRLIEMRMMDECRGSTNWLTVWRAEPVFR